MTRTEPLDSPTESAQGRLFRWAPLVGLPVFLIIVSVLFLRPIGDPDSWWHLRLGSALTMTWDFTDPPAWTRFATQPWVATQWLPEVAASWLEQRAGLAGLVWLLIVVALALVASLYAVCRREGGALPALLATVLGFAGVAPTMTPRPQVVTFVLLAVSLGAWLATARDLRPRWWLVPLSWLWACCHGFWFTGAAVGLVVVVGLWLDRRVRIAQALRLLAVPALSIAVAALTPVGPRLLLSPFAVGSITGFITEWQTPSIRDPAPAVTLFMIVVVVFTQARRRKRTSWVWVGLLFLAVVWALMSVRTVSLAAIVVAPLVAGSLAGLLPTRDEAPLGIQHHERILLVSSVAVCVIAAAALAAVLPALRLPGAVPTQLDPMLDRLPAHSVVWNDFSLGGWIDWRHPSLEVVVDGRAEAFGAAYLEQYGRTMAADPGWDQRIQQSEAHVAVLPSDSALADALQHRLGWRAVARDGDVVLLSDGTTL
jgi:hypothetical protein